MDRTFNQVVQFAAEPFKALGISTLNGIRQLNLNTSTQRSNSLIDTESLQGLRQYQRDIGKDEIEFNNNLLPLIAKKNDENNRALGNELRTRFPYAQYETESKLYGAADRARDIAINAGQALKYNMGNYVSL